MLHFVVTTDGAVRSYKKVGQATAMALQLNTASLQAGGSQVAYPATDADLSQLPSSLLVVLHNLIRPEKPIKKFADRETAEKRMKGVLEVLAKPGEAPTDEPVEGAAETTEEEGTTESTESSPTTTNEEGTDMATKAAKKSGRKAAKKTTTTTEAGAGRPSAFAGKIIRKVATGNPRREGSLGYKSWEVLKSGMTYEKYIAAGGRRTDLAWDLAKGFVKLEKA